ncbi:hypothetical protein [Nitratireductor sp. XY-223]|uniref:hypothetical protein n=1 Tax=Nitratireductor sp. XY-223 TaxID=2561926 RepID=UPI0010A9F2FB|nr:hypothetical protein [Nitratireductor sp. XY-223]
MSDHGQADDEGEDRALAVDAVVSEKIDADEYIKRLLPAHREHQRLFSRLLVFCLALIFVTGMVQIPETTAEQPQNLTLFGAPLPLDIYLYSVLVFFVLFSVPYSASRLRSSETHNLIAALSILQGNRDKPLLLRIKSGCKPSHGYTKHRYVTALMDGGFHSVKTITDNASPFLSFASRLTNKYVIHPAMCFVPLIGVGVTVGKLYEAINRKNDDETSSFICTKILNCPSGRRPVVDYFLDMNVWQSLGTAAIAVGTLLAILYCWNAYRSVLLGIEIQKNARDLLIWSNHPSLRYLRGKPD